MIKLKYMRIEDFKNKKVTVMGLGLLGGGVGTAKFFAKVGAKVTVTDIKSKKELKESVLKLKNFKVDFVLGKHKKEDFISADFIVRGAFIPETSPYLEIAKKNKIPIDTDIGIFFELCRVPIIGITGSKGKSTTAALIHKVLKIKFKNILLGGNIGVSALDLLQKIKKDSIVVLELSSWQLESLLSHKKSPHIAVITNIFPEHLDRYKNFNDYLEAKKIIFKFQKNNDYLILNNNLKKYHFSSKSKIIYFSGKEREIVKIIGEIYKIPKEKIQKQIDNFKGLEGRTEFIGKIKGVKFYNDTCATHPEATIYSIKKIKEKDPLGNIILIAGGEDKNLDFNNFNKFISREIKTLVLFPGKASKKIKINIPTIKVKDMAEAVKKAKRIAKKGDIILLSPAATSFNLFKNEFDRGAQFKKLVKEW